MGTVLEEGPPTVHISTRQRPTYFELANQIEAIEKLGKWIAMSKMFGCDSLDQGCVIAADCFLTGMTLLEYQRRNKIVNGKPFNPMAASPPPSAPAAQSFSARPPFPARR